MSDNDFFGGRRRRRAGAAFSPYSLFASGEQGVWYDPSDLTPEKVSWRRNLLTYSQDFENAAWTKSNASILSNLALYSQDFDNASWVKQTNATVTANTSTAPDGTTTADTLTTTGGTAVGTYYVSAPVSASVAYTTSIYAKAGTTTVIRFGLSNQNESAQAYYDFDVANGTIGASAILSFTSASSSIVSVGSGWYRCIVTATAPASGTTSIGAFLRNTTAGTSLLWGAQLVPGSTAQTYTRSLATAAPIQFADPLGGTLADKLVENTAANIHYQIQSLTALSPANKTYAVSAYLKDADGRLATLGISDVSTGTRFAVANFNLTNGTVAASGANGPEYAVVSSSIQDVGNGWYRCIVVCTAGTTVTSLGAVVGLSNQSAIPTGAGGFVSYTGNGTSGFYVYGAQVEQASTASAYQRITDFSSDFLAAFPTHALYQESTGVTPVTALGQSVGYVFDKRLGPMGDNLFGYSSWQTIGGWEATSNATLSVSSGQLVLHATGANASSGYRLTTVVGKQYQFRVRLVQDAMTGNSFMGAGSGGGSGWAANLANLNLGSTPGTYSITFTATSTDTRLSLFGSSGSVAGEILVWAEPMVREVPGNHALQATLAAQPTLQARSNLLTYSEQFDNAAWTKTRSSITANTAVAPDGTSTADKLVEDTSVTLSHAASAAVTALTATYVFSCYLKSSGRTIGVLTYDSLSAWFNLANGTVGTVDAGLTASITDAGNGWYRCAIVRATTAGSKSVIVYTATTDGQLQYTGNGVDGILVWGAQLELGSTASTYQRVVTATNYADVGLPRNLTFDGIDDSLATAGNVDFATWTVGSRRNLLTVPTMFDDAAWVKGNASITANTAVAPDGTTTADKLVENATLNFHQVNQAVATVGATQTFSVYAKAVERTQIVVQLGGFNSAVYNLSNGTVVGSGASIVDAGNGWYRCIISATVVTNGNCLIYPYVGGTGNYLGDGTSGVLLWGAQLEVGSTATAFQDVGTDKVTLFSGVTKLSDAALGMMTELTTGGVAGSFYVLAPNGAASPAYQWRSSGTILVNVDSPATYAAPITNVLTGIGNISGDVATIRLNGTQAATSSADQGTGTYASALLYVGRRAGTSLQFNGRLFQLVIRGAATDSVTVGNAERWVGQLTGVAL